MKKILLMTLFAGCIASAEPFATMNLINSGNLFGNPGDTVGWGFQITAAQSVWLLPTAVDFVSGMAPVGVFTPYVTLPQNWSVVIGASTGAGELNPWTQTFNPVLQTGIGSYQINSFVSPGDQTIGQIIVYFDVYSRSPNDPLFNPVTDTVAVGQSVAAAASVTVGTEPTPTPEPTTFACIGLGMAGLAAAASRRRRRP